MLVPRLALAVAALSGIALITLGLAEEFGVGLSDPIPPTDDLEQQIINVAIEHEDWYMAYGRWDDLFTAIAFACLVVAAPFLRGAWQSRHIVIVGAAVAALGDMIDLAQLVGIDIARWALDEGLATDFTAGNSFRFLINATSTYVWVAGLVFVSIGLIVLAFETSGTLWKATNAAFATDLYWPGQQFQIASWALSAVALGWIVVAYAGNLVVLGRPESATTN